MVAIAMVVGWAAVLAAIGLTIWGFGWLFATQLNSFPHPL